jgi:hypothetical protein
VTKNVAPTTAETGPQYTIGTVWTVPGGASYILLDNPPGAGEWQALGNAFTGGDTVRVTGNDTTAQFLKDKLTAGTNITLTEENDGGVETLRIDAASGGGSTGPLDGAHATHSGTDNLNATATDNLVPWDTEVFKDTDITHSTVTNNSRWTFDRTSKVLVHCGITVDGSGTPRYQGAVYVRKNGTTTVGEYAVSTYARFTNGIDCAEFQGSWIIEVTAGDYLEFLIDRRGDKTAAMSMRTGESSCDFVYLEGTIGPKGDDGAPGAGSTVLVQDEGTNLPNTPHSTLDFRGDIIEATDQGSGVARATVDHRPADQLVHGVAEDSHTQVTRVGGRVTNITVWTDSGETVKIRETQITRTSGQISQIVTTHYDAAGAAITGEIYTEDVNRVSGRVDSIDGVLA